MLIVGQLNATHWPTEKGKPSIRYLSSDGSSSSSGSQKGKNKKSTNKRNQEKRDSRIQALENVSKTTTSDVKGIEYSVNRVEDDIETTKKDIKKKLQEKGELS